MQATASAGNRPFYFPPLRAGRCPLDAFMLEHADRASCLSLHAVRPFLVDGQRTRLEERLSAEVTRVLPDGVVHSHVRRERRRVEERLVALVALVYPPAESDEDVARAPVAGEQVSERASAAGASLAARL